MVTVVVYGKRSTNEFYALMKLVRYRTIDKLVTCIAPTITYSHSLPLSRC